MWIFAAPTLHTLAWQHAILYLIVFKSILFILWGKSVFPCCVNYSYFTGFQLHTQNSGWSWYTYFDLITLDYNSFSFLFHVNYCPASHRALNFTHKEEIAFTRIKFSKQNHKRIYYVNNKYSFLILPELLFPLLVEL